MARLVLLLLLSLGGFYYYHNKSNLNIEPQVAVFKDNVVNAGNKVKSEIKEADVASLVNNAIDDFNSSSLPDANTLLKTLEEALKILEDRYENMSPKDKAMLEDILNDLSLRTSVIDSSLLDDNQKLKLASLQNKTINLLKQVKNS